MEPFRGREMDSSQRAMDGSPGSAGQQHLRGGPQPSRPAGAAALARPPALPGMPVMPGSPSGLGPSQAGFGYLGQPLAAPPSQQGQNHRLIQMQRQQQLRHLHSQRRQNPVSAAAAAATAASQQSQSLSQLQQNYMQHLASDRLGNSQRSTGSDGSSSALPQMPPQQQQQQEQGPAHPKTSGLQPPPQSLHMNRSNSNAAMSFAPPGSAAAASQTKQNGQPPPPSYSPSSATGPQTKAPPPLIARNKSDSATHPNMPPPSSNTGANGSSTSSMVASTPLAASTNPAAAAPLPPLPAVSEKEIPGLLQKCDWKDKTLWVSRQLLGGQALNGFMRSTATVQRIKRQRVRQVKPKDTPKSAHSTGDDVSVSSNPSTSGKKREAPASVDQAMAEEQELKHLVLNARTAKKMKSELDVGLKFCETMHETIRGILKEMEVPAIVIPPSLGPELPRTVPPRNGPLMRGAAAASNTLTKPPVVGRQTSRASSTATSSKGLVPTMPIKPNVQPPPKVAVVSAQSTTAAGSAKKSTFRRTRRKKLPPSNELNVGLSEFDTTGKRLLSKKDYSQRVFEVIRFRALRQGDHVAARLSSRDLWILARVTKDYPGVTLPAVQFLQLSVTRRDALFKERVLLRDVEDKDSGQCTVGRNLVLPLPRNYSEAAEWGQHYRKGSRVYAMYPETTSLYTATVVDNTTYCQGDDDIIVVEFDGDEPDHTGSPPKCHIPARFVTFIPREFPSFQDKPVRRQSAAAPVAAPGPAPAFADPLNNLDLSLETMGSFDGFDDLDFDLGLGNA